jgi:hypothetical protein
MRLRRALASAGCPPHTGFIPAISRRTVNMCIIANALIYIETRKLIIFSTGRQG